MFPGLPRKLLIVDDDPGIHETLRQALGREYAITSALSGEDGIEAAKREEFPVVILDLRMAGMSGVEVLEHLQQLNARQRVIIFTAYANMENTRDCLNLGAFKHVTKPLCVPEIRELVRKGFEQYGRDAAAHPIPVDSPEKLKVLGLSPREAEVAFWLAWRESNAQIAERLSIALRTAENHVAAVLAKLGAPRQDVAKEICERLRWAGNK